MEVNVSHFFQNWPLAALLLVESLLLSASPARAEDLATILDVGAGITTRSGDAPLGGEINLEVNFDTPLSRLFFRGVLDSIPWNFRATAGPQYMTSWGDLYGLFFIDAGYSLEGGDPLKHGISTRITASVFFVLGAYIGMGVMDLADSPQFFGEFGLTAVIPIID